MYKSESITFITDPTAAPSNVQSTATTSSSLTFTWDEIPCGSRGGDISYKYIFDSSAETSTTDKSVTFNQLAACSSYDFKVRGSNTKGDGPWSSTVSAETNDEGKVRQTRDNDPRATRFCQ